MSIVIKRPMRPWMKIFLSLLVVLFSGEVLSCSLKKDHRVISLSGTTTYLFKELGLLKDLHGISVFNPVASSEYKGKVYPGGSFLSENSLQDMKGSVVFFDESISLKKTFTTKQYIISKEIKTRGLLPLEAMDKGFQEMDFVLSGCEKKIKGIKADAVKIQKQLLNKIPDKTIVFYLGEIRSGRRPEMVIVNDGVVKLLLIEKKLRTYPSDLGFVNWSSRIINSLPQDTLHIALNDPSMEEKKEIKRSPLGVTFTYSGVLVPGLSQLRAFQYLFNSL